MSRIQRQIDLVPVADTLRFEVIKHASNGVHVRRPFGRPRGRVGLSVGAHVLALERPTSGAQSTASRRWCGERFRLDPLAGHRFPFRNRRGDAWRPLTDHVNVDSLGSVGRSAVILARDREAVARPNWPRAQLASARLTIDDVVWRAWFDLVARSGSTAMTALAILA